MFTSKSSRYVWLCIADIRHNVVEYDDRIVRQFSCWSQIRVKCHIIYKQVIKLHMMKLSRSEYVQFGGSLQEISLHHP